MTYEHIKNLLQLSCNFNTSSISHSFTISKDDTLRVRCLKDTFILEVTSSASQQIDYYTSVDQAAQALYQKVNADEINELP